MEIKYKELIEKVLLEKGAGNGLHVKDIATRIMSSNTDMFNGSLNYEDILKKTQSILSTDVKKVNGTFSKVKNSKTGVFKKGIYKIKPSLRPVPQPPITPLPEDLIPNIATPKDPSMNLYVGKAGECAVMSELLFRGYNVNSMLVDDGVDIVASKSNVFYYVQVKTTAIKNENKFHVTIDKDRFTQFIGLQMRYVIVGRCLAYGEENNMFFVFSGKDIDNFIYNKCAKYITNGVSLKIEIEKGTNIPYLYDEKRTNIDFYRNNFL